MQDDLADKLTMTNAVIPREVAIEQADFLGGRALAMYLTAGLTFEQAAKRLRNNWKYVRQRMEASPELREAMVKIGATG